MIVIAENGSDRHRSNRTQDDIIIEIQRATMKIERRGNTFEVKRYQRNRGWR